MAISCMHACQWLLLSTMVAFPAIDAFGIHHKRARGWWNTNEFLSFRNQDSFAEEDTTAPCYNNTLLFSDMNTNNMLNTSMVQLPPNNQTTTVPSKRAQSIPVLGPFMNTPPLLVGSTMYIERPTPQQWSSLETSVQLHHDYEDAGTRIKAAPIIAIVDNHTSHYSDGMGQYATLAAVVGISKTTRNAATNASAIMNPLDSKIRLVGIGRARLQKFFYKSVNHETKESDDDQEEANEEDCSHDSHVQEYEDEIWVECAECGAHLRIIDENVKDALSQTEEDQEDDEMMDAPVVMGEFVVLVDGLGHDINKSNDWYKGTQTAQSSPVHALTKMSTLHNKLLRLHNERRKLVQDVKAAKFRLEKCHFYEDLDGIGQVTQKENNNCTQVVLQNPGEDNGDNDKNCDTTKSLDPSVLDTMENYGLGPCSSMSSLLDLTDAAMETLKPYYSPTTRQEEEFRMIVASFVAFKALEGFCSSSEMAWALTNTNTVERLSRAHEIMTKHVTLLKEKGKQLKQDLKECGGKGDDLF